MPDKRTSDRFARLEIPEGPRVDWSFLDTPAPLPPLPIDDQPIAAYVDGRVLVPADAGEASIVLYDLSAPLAAHEPLALEAAWRARCAAGLTGARARFRGTIPVPVLDDATHAATAKDTLRARLHDEIPDRDKALRGAHTDASHWLRVVGHARLLRLHHKLYELRTLHEYTTVFAKAIEPDVMNALQRLPRTAAPAEFLATIAQSLDRIHPKARSPLRNKMDTSRVVIGGVTLLPMYVGPAKGLFDRYAERLSAELALAAFG